MQEVGIPFAIYENENTSAKLYFCPHVLEFSSPSRVGGDVSVLISYEVIE